MYLSHFNLKEKPFRITSDPKFLWLGEKHKEALSTLRYGILDNKGFVMLTGEVGTGKTVLINQLITMVDFSTIIATIPDPDLESLDFFKLLADGFSIKKPFMSKGGFLLHLRDFLHESYSKQKQVVLIIDEAQRLNHKLLEEIRLLSNIELHDRKLINIFFVGQTEFNEALMDPRNRAVAQRITVKYAINPLDTEEVGEFIHHRLKIAGTDKEIFDDTAVRAVHAFSKGIPRLINIVCDHSLLTAYAQGINTVNGEIVNECARELHMPMKKVSNEKALQESVEELKNQIIEDVLRRTGVSLEKGLSVAGEQSANTVKIKGNNFGIPRTSSNISAVRDVDIRDPDRKRSWLGLFLVVCVSLFILGTTGYLMLNLRPDDKPSYGAEKHKNDTFDAEIEKNRDDFQAAIKEDVNRQNNTNTNNKAIKIPPGEGSNSSTGTSSPINVDDIFGPDKKITIHFELNSNEMQGDKLALLDKVAQFLRQHDDEFILIKGYTDAVGNPSYNLSVSQFRANTVKSYLIGKGAPFKSLKALGLGDAYPIADNATIEGRVLNRRVEIVLTTAEQ
jgi:general secretion pathway protein A